MLNNNNLHLSYFWFRDEGKSNIISPSNSVLGSTNSWMKYSVSYIVQLFILSKWPFKRKSFPLTKVSFGSCLIHTIDDSKSDIREIFQPHALYHIFPMGICLFLVWNWGIKSCVRQMCKPLHCGATSILKQSTLHQKARLK